MKPWAIYIRVSTDDQAEEGASIPAQEDSCRAYARARGWQVLPPLIDDGYTGRNDRRPGYQKILAMMRERSITGVIAWKLKRLSRRARDIHDLMDLLKETTCELATVAEHWDTTTPMGRAMVGVGAIFAQLESDDNGVQTSAAMQYLRRHGYFTGGHVPPGCRVAIVDEGKRRRLERDEHGALVADAWPQVIAGASLREVAARLAAAGVRSPQRRGARTPGWSPAAVRNLLLSPLVTGVLVDAATQAVVRQVLAQRTTPLRRGRDRDPGARAVAPSPLAGLLRCPACESAMHQVTATGHGGTYRYFRCTAKGKGLCRQKDVRCEPVEREVVDAVGEAVGPGGPYHAKVHQLLQEARGRLEAARIDRARLTAERDQLTARVAELTLRTQIGTKVWDEAMKSLGVELERVDKRLAELAGIVAAGEVDQTSLDLVLEEIARGAANLSRGTVEEQTRVLRTLIAAVRLAGDEVVIDLYEPAVPPGKDEPRGEPRGSSIARYWRPGTHGARTVRVRVVRRHCAVGKRPIPPGS
jgi:DNA invertase Pin-like site-specific DNA recombinase